MINSYAQDTAAQDIIQGIARKDNSFKHYQYHQGLITVDEKVYLGSQGDDKQAVLWELHDSLVGGHSGQDATYRRIAQFFFWPGMRKEIIKYVQDCDTCQRVKSGNQHPLGLLQPLPVPDQIWKDISLRGRIA